MMGVRDRGADFERLHARALLSLVHAWFLGHELTPECKSAVCLNDIWAQEA